MTSTGESFLPCANYVDPNAVIGNMSTQQLYDCLSRMLPTLIQNSLGSMPLNSKMQESDVSPHEGDTNMASKFRSTYTYTDPQGDSKTIRLNGQSKQDTDLQFQEFLGQTTFPIRKPAKTLRQFILEDYRPTFTTSLSPTTLKSYTRHQSIIAHQDMINSLVESQLVVPT